MKPTHLLEFSSGTTVTLGPELDEGLLTHPLTVLDGSEYNHLILTRLVRPAWPDELSKDELAESEQTFLQAGGSADAMTLEIRVQAKDGDYVQYIVGRPHSTTGQERISVHVGKHTYEVAPNEVFNAEQAGEAMVYYFKHDTVPPECTLRKLIRTVN